MVELNYSEDPEAYDQAVDALGYEDPFQELEEEKQKKVAEVAEMNSILNGDTGSIAGMNYHHSGRASD